MIIYHIELPKNHDLPAFLKFMREEYFPAVHKGSTRLGQVASLSLLQAHPEGTNRSDFFLHVGWSGFDPGPVRLDDDDGKVASKLESFKASVKHFGVYNQVAAWPEKGGAS